MFYYATAGGTILELAADPPRWFIAVDPVESWQR